MTWPLQKALHVFDAQAYKKASLFSTIFNGEIYNPKYFDPQISDTTILSKNLAVCQNSDQIFDLLSDLDGPFSLIYHARNKIYFGRDKFGRRSLLSATNSEGEIFISSVAINLPDMFKIRMKNFSETVLAGQIFEISSQNFEPKLVGKLQLKQPFLPATKIQSPEDLPSVSPSNLVQTSEFYQNLAQKIDQFLENSILTRTKISSNIYAKNVSVFFSGGLDSTVIAYYLGKYGNFETIELVNVTFWTAHGKFTSPDREHAESAFLELTKLLPDANFVKKYVNVPTEDLEKQAQNIAFSSYPRITIIDESLATSLHFLAQHASHKHIFSGLGADELFGGYTRHLRAFQKGEENFLQSWQLCFDEVYQEFQRIGERNLGRDDRMISFHGKEIRLPFLDENLVEFVGSLDIFAKCRPDFGAKSWNLGAKYLLRLVAQNLGLTETATRMKQAMQFGTRSAKALNKGNKKIHKADSTVSDNLAQFF